MNLLDKINNNISELTSEELEIISQSEELTQALINSVSINKPDPELFNKMSEESIKRIIFKDGFFDYFIGLVEVDTSAHDEFLAAVFNLDDYFSEFITPENEKEAMAKIGALQDKYFDEVTDKLENDPEFVIVTTSLRIINYIIQHKLYQRAGCIGLKSEEISPEIEDFLLQVLINYDDIILGVRTPKITDYCLNNNCLHRIINSFNPHNPDEVEIIKEAIENDKITFEQMKGRGFSYAIVDSPKFILQKILADFSLTDEQVAFVSNTPSLINQIIEIISKTTGNISWEISSLADKIPELKISLIKYNKSWSTYNNKSVLEDYLTHEEDNLPMLLNEYHDSVMDAIRYFFKNNPDQVKKIAEMLLLRTDFDEIRNLTFDVLSSEDYTSLLVSNLKLFINYNISKDEVENICKLITEKNISLVLADQDIDIFNRKYSFGVLTTLLNNVTTTLLDKAVDGFSYNSDVYSLEQQQEILSIIIDKAIQFKVDYLNRIIYKIKEIAKPEDVQRIMENSKDLHLKFDSVFDFQSFEDLKEMSYEDLITLFDKADSFDANSIYRLSNILNENNVEIIRWILSSPKLVINEYLFNTLSTAVATYNNHPIYDKLFAIAKEFFINNRNIPIKYTVGMDLETIKKATIDSDDEYFIDNIDLFKRNQWEYIDSNYYVLLLNKIKERVNEGKQTNVKLLLMCLNKIKIDDETLKALLDSDLLYWDNKTDSVKEISSYANNVLFNNYFYKNIIPTLSIHTINNRTIPLSSLVNYMPDFLNRLNQMIASGVGFNGNILELLLYNNNGVFDEFLNKLYELDLIDYNNIPNNVLKSEYPLVDKIIVNKIIPNLNILSNNLDEIFNYTGVKYVDLIAKQIDKESNISHNFAINDMMMYPSYYQAIVKAFREGRVSLYGQFYSRLLDVNILDAIIEHDFNDISLIITYLIHNNQNPSDEIFEFLIPHICKYKNFNLDNFKLLYKEYGKTIIPLLDNENFLLLCNQDMDSIKRFVSLLEPRTLDKMMIEGINNSIRQNIFSVKNPQIMTTFTIILSKIQNNIFEEERDYYLNLLLPAVADNLDKLIIETENQLLLEYYKTDKTKFLNYLFDCLKENQDLYGNLFNAITTNYIIIKRNEFGNQDDIFRDTKVEFIYDKKVLYDTLFKELLENDRIKLLKFLKLPTYLLEENLSNDEIDEEDFINYYTIQFLLGRDVGSQLNKEQLIQVKRNIRNLKESFYEKINSNILFNRPLPSIFMHYLDDPLFTAKLKKILVPPTRSKNLAEELSKVSVKVLFEKVINDPEKFEVLLEVIKKYRLLDWGDIFEPTISQLSIANEIENLYSFVNAFNQIYESEKKSIMKNKYPKVLVKAEEMRNRGASEEEIQKFMEKELKVQFNAFKILRYCSMYSAIPNCYKVLLGIEDFEIVKKNEGPYSSNNSIEERMERVSEVHLKAIKQQEISIPSFIVDKEIKNGKRLRAIVGNRAHPRNMCHGERTGACMRALGYADSKNYGDDRANNLFEFSSTNFNGFHITILNPDTGEYVSRISGFRNGNTVFLNQLRYVVKDVEGYTNEDVIEAMKLFAEEIIERSKDSEYPIENVVASATYALERSETQSLSSSDIGRGVYIGYRDVTSNAVVLATTGKDGKAVDLDLDNTRHPHYKCVRVYPEEIVGTLSDRDKIKLQRITAIKQLLEHEDDPSYLKGIDIDTEALEEEYVYVIIGQDWFISLNTDLEIKSDIIPLDERAQLEFDEAMQKVIEFKENNYGMSGGLANG